MSIPIAVHSLRTTPALESQYFPMAQIDVMRCASDGLDHDREFTSRWWDLNAAAKYMAFNVQTTVSQDWPALWSVPRPCWNELE